LLDAEVEGDRSPLPRRVHGNQVQSVAVVPRRFLRGEPPGRVTGRIEEQREGVRSVDVGDGQAGVISSSCRGDAAREVG
jgi:hypothetical protein